ncbi:MAG: OsmC family protein [Sphingobacteriales bacterium]|jgi:peroxiredoxin-like protein|nr:MAG: OsmC family protein [Sphingobacteriales bacterium]
MEPHYYQVKIQWKEGRLGVLSSAEINLEKNILEDGISVATPPPFAGGMPQVFSPEHLYTAAVASCLMTTFLAIAENSKINFISFDCEAKGKLEQVEGKFLMTEVILNPVVQIEDEALLDKTKRILDKAEKACLISNSINSTITFNPIVKV